MEKSNNRKTINLANGYATIPADWIVVSNPFGLDSEATELAVVEAMNWQKYGVPHFAVPVSAGCLTDDTCDQIISACCDVYPKLEDIIAQQVEIPRTDPEIDPEYWDKLEKAVDSPLLGVFRVMDTDDEDYNPIHYCPFGVVVKREYSPENNEE